MIKFLSLHNNPVKPLVGTALTFPLKLPRPVPIPITVTNQKNQQQPLLTNLKTIKMKPVQTLKMPNRILNRKIILKKQTIQKISVEIWKMQVKIHKRTATKTWKKK
uniref:Uncharacterized protein n=1 Tax=Cacopsylla melanoneura TaxID=428564 RepID=A0A8D8PT33_9HEMI